MVNEFFKGNNIAFGRFFEPARQFQTLLVDNAEKLANFQLAAAREYADIGAQNLRDGLAVSDPASFQSYVAGQGDVARTVARKIQDDTQKLVGLQQEFGKAYQGLLQESARGFGNQADATVATVKPKTPEASGKGSKTA